MSSLGESRGSLGLSAFCCRCSVCCPTGVAWHAVLQQEIKNRYWKAHATTRLSPSRVTGDTAHADSTAVFKLLYIVRLLSCCPPGAAWHALLQDNAGNSPSVISSQPCLANVSDM
jgi:hypothetical protein